MKTNVWNSIEQRLNAEIAETTKIDASIDQWHSRLKTCICAKGGHFKHMT